MVPHASGKADSLALGAPLNDGGKDVACCTDIRGNATCSMTNDQRWYHAMQPAVGKLSLRSPVHEEAINIADASSR